MDPHIYKLKSFKYSTQLSRPTNQGYKQQKQIYDVMAINIVFITSTAHVAHKQINSTITK